MKEKAWAKVNFHLDVLKRRVDNYHDLEMVMAPLALHDVLTFKKLNEDTIKITESVQTCDTPEDNIAYKVANYLKETFNIKKGIHIHIEKHIPIAAGLAGGSADAAATLRGMNKLFKLKMTLEQLADIGEKFGADIPFCVHSRLCIARGKGEQLFFLKGKLNIPLLLVTPNLRVSTKEIFSLVDMKDIKNVKITTMTNAIYNKNYDLIAQALYNALEPFAFQKYPEIESLKRHLESEQLDGVVMSGSGPTVVAIDKDKKKLRDVSLKYQEDFQVHLSKIT